MSDTNRTFLKMYQRSADIPRLKLDRGANTVYVVSNPKTGLVKIGFSSAPRHRIDFLELASGTRFDPICISPYFRDAKFVEYRLHSIFQERRAIGEWFAVPFDEAADALEDFCAGSKNRFGRAAA